MAPRNLLVFGGNGFLGAAVVKRLLARGDKVTIVSRGNWYWDTSATIKPFVQHVKFDRHNPSLDNITNFQKIVDENTYDAVLDFSAMKALAIENTLKVLKGKIKIYIYISSDSVYEVCRWKDHDGYSKETDSGRPEDPVLREKYAKADDYGHEKMKGEEVLSAQTDFPHVFLRLPDIIGPEDTTNRFWFYQMWVKLSAQLNKPVALPAEVADVPMRLVYTEDVATAFVEILDSGDKVHNQAFNLACVETVSLRQYYQLLQKELDVENLKFNADTDFRFFPLCFRGPVDVTKATRMIGWSPARFEDVFKKTVKFCDEAMRQYPLQRDEVAVTLSKVLKIDRQKVFDAIKTVYGIDDVPTELQHKGLVVPEWFMEIFIDNFPFANVREVPVDYN